MLNKDLGQVFTPASVAKFMVDWLCQFNPNKIYDPCYGGGAFYHALENKNILYEATEIDPRFVVEPFVVQADYLTHDWKRKYGCIVCNPPYMKVSKVENKNQIYDLFYKYTCQKISGYANLATLFLMKALYQLDDNGQLAFIMPFDFLSANYGVVIKRILKEMRCKVQFIRLTCEKEVFPTVTTSIVIVLVDRSRSSDHISFHTIESLDNLYALKGSHLKVEIDSIDPSTKWVHYFQEAPKKLDPSLYKGYASILKYGKFSRGIATGCDKFFILKPSELKQYGLTQDDCIPCLAKLKDLNSNIFTDEDFEKLVQNDRKVFLVNLEKNTTKEVQNYIKLGESSGICSNYTLRNRSPWYKLEKRTKSTIWLGVFSRNNFKLIKNNTNLVTLTTIHGFFPNQLGLKYQDALFQYLSSDEGLLQIKSFSRKSANNLNAVQPGDLNKLKVPDFSSGG
jgi:adenine-specific DNA-methyltransferase